MTPTEPKAGSDCVTDDTGLESVVCVRLDPVILSITAC